jgi:hypothetical protein
LFLSSFIRHIVIFLFATFTTEWVVEARFNRVVNEAERFFIDIDKAAAHSAMDWLWFRSVLKAVGP